MTEQHPTPDLLRAIQTMVRSAAEKSIPKLPRFIPQFELALWDEDELNAVAVAFDKAVDARIDARIAAMRTAA